MHYYLYFPGARGMTDEHLVPCGLADLSRETGPAWFELERGPDGHRGMACTWLRGDSSDPPLGMLPSQDWTPCRPAGGAQPIAKGAYWIGLDREQPVRPKDLERKRMHAGHPVALDDGQAWTVPIARLLPHSHGLDEEGGYSRRIHPRYAALWERSRYFAEELLTVLRQLLVLSELKDRRASQTMAAEFDMGEAFTFAVEVLALNYRLNAELISTLGLLNDCGLLDVIKAVVDLPTLIGVEREKKKASSSLPRERLSIPVGLST